MMADLHSRTTGPFRWAWPAGRALLALLFLVSGGLKFAFHAPIAGAIATKGVPAPDLVAWAVALFEVAAALALIAGFRLFEVSLALGAWSLLTAIVFHDFWRAAGMEQQLQLANFLKNVALLGAFLIVARDARAAVPTKRS